MLLAYENVNPSLLNPYSFTHTAYVALANGELEVLAHNPDRPIAVEDRDIAQLLLDQPSTAIMHLPESKEPRLHDTGIELGKSAVLLAVNYHDGHSEGRHRIVVQNPADQDEGQYELWIPPGSRNRTFYRRLLSPYMDTVHRFEKMPVNPLKIQHHYMHVGPPDEAISDFKKRGYTFSKDVLMTKIGDRTSEFYRLERLSAAAGRRWAPFARSKV